MEWPIQKDDGKYSTTPTAKAVWKATIEASTASPELKDRALASLAAAKNWRKQYIGALEDYMLLLVNTPAEDAIRMAEAGIEAVQTSMVFRHKDDDKTVSARDAFFGSDDAVVPALDKTKVLSKPSNSDSTGATEKPYRFSIASPNGDWLRGDGAKDQLKAWADYGAMEPSAADLASIVCKANDCSSFVQDKVFVLLGATSSMGPAKTLLQIPGAHVMAVARDGKRLSSFMEWYEEHGAPGSTLEIGPADLIGQGPSVAQWVVKTCRSHNKAVVLCSLIYMDGEAHVRASTAMDLIVDYTTVKLGANRVSLSYLSTPGLIFPVPPEAAKDAQSRHQKASSWQYLTSWVPGWLEPTNSWQKPGNICNALSSVQGPNYALAKMLQYWRCMVAASSSKNGQVVSAPMAPGSRTESMVRYETVASALEGGQFFAPMLAFSVESASSLMTAILLAQMSRTGGPQVLAHPTHVVWDGSVHGGVFRVPYKMDSVGVASYLLGKTVKAPYIPNDSVAQKDESNE